jgi:hypothetical protein
MEAKLRKYPNKPTDQQTLSVAVISFRESHSLAVRLVVNVLFQQTQAP